MWDSSSATGCSLRVLRLTWASPQQNCMAYCNRGLSASGYGNMMTGGNLLAFSGLMQGCVQAAKAPETPELARTQELLADLAHASTRRFVYFRGRATVYAKPGTNWFQKFVRI